MTELDRWQSLKSKADRLKSKKDQATGAIKQLKSELKAEFGIDNVKDGEKESKKLDTQHTDLGREFKEMLEEAETKWGGNLEGR